MYHPLLETWVNFHLGTLANRTGRIAGINAAGGDAEFPGALGSAVSRIGELEVGRTGLTEWEAKEAGMAVKSARIESWTRAHYFPGARKAQVKLIVEDTGKLLGGQIVGGPGAAKRIDVVSAAIAAGSTAEQLMEVDFSYAPPLSPVWDPVQMAARQLV
jgi:NADPH-dependent 2,4-dienoyl-CoA reductase/sulfur reductase-like enzyme